MTKQAISSAISAYLAGVLPRTRIEYEDGARRTGDCEFSAFHDGDITVLICSELAANAGPSITNAAPAPWESAQDETELRGTVIWVEHYGPASDGRIEHAFDLVTADAHRVPRWQHLARVRDSQAA